MDYNKIYKARYLCKQGGITDIKEIAEQTGLSIEMVRKAVDNSMKDYPTIKRDYTEDQEAGEFSRTYEVPTAKRLRAEKLQDAVARYVRLVVEDAKTMDQIKSLLIADDIQDGQIGSILKEVRDQVAEHKTEALGDIVEELLAIEQLPPKFTINKAMEVVTVYPSPLIDHSGYIYGVKYSSKPVDWRKGLPTELAIALYERENRLYIDGQELSCNPDRWGPREYEILVGKTRKSGYFAELADFLGLEYEDLKPYIARARAHVKQARKEAETEPADFKKVARIVAGLMAEYRANGGNIKKERKRAEADTAVTE